MCLNNGGFNDDVLAYMLLPDAGANINSTYTPEVNLIIKPWIQ